MLVSSDGFSDVSGFNFKLLGCLLLSWVVVYACMFKGKDGLNKTKCPLTPSESPESDLIKPAL